MRYENDHQNYSILLSILSQEEMKDHFDFLHAWKCAIVWLQN